MSAAWLTPAVAFALTLVATAAYSALHSLLATSWAKRRARMAFGPGPARLYRLIYNAVGAVTFLPVLAVPAIQPGPTLYAVPAPWRWMLVTGQLAGAAVVLLGLLQTDIWHFLGLRQLVEPTDDRPARLVTTGLYRHVRHPLYSGGLLFLWLTPVMTTTLLSLSLGLTAYLVIGSLFEERRLIAEFGEAYLDYRSRVPRLIPRLGQAPPGR